MKHEVTFITSTDDDLRKLLGAGALAGFTRARVKTIIVDPETTTERPKPKLVAGTSVTNRQARLPLDETIPDGTEDYTIGHNTHRGSGIKPYEFANGKADKGITARDLLLDILRSENRVFTGPEIAHRFKARGFNEYSYTAAANVLLKDNTIRRVARSRYCIPGTIVHPPVQ
jgi:hypothetical protein